jgi:predicted amidohydrolase YtcJ
VVSGTTAEGTARKIREAIVNAIRVQKIPEGQWITVALQENNQNIAGTTGTWLFLGNVNRRQIDAGTENNPAIIKMGIFGLFNTAAVEAFKEEFPDWEHSVDWENRPGAGEDGYAPVPEQQGMTFEFWWKDEPIEKLSEALRLHGLDVRRYGITTVSTRMLFPSVAAAYQKLNREGKMPHRLSYYVESQRGQYFNPKSTQEFYRASGAAWTNHVNGGQMLWIGGMANEIWDSLRNEACLGPDVPAPPEIMARQRCPVPGTKPYDSYKIAVMNGWRPVQGHSIGSHAARLYIQMMDEAMEEKGFSLEYMRNLRTTLEHNTVLGLVPDVIAGIKKYGIILNPQPPNLSRAEQFVEDYGEQVRPFLMPVKTWINEGIRVTYEARGTDFWSPLHILVTRRVQKQGSDEWITVLPQEAIDRVTALKMVTTWGAEYVLGEDTLGTLEPGKYADFAVLDKDFFTIPVDEIPYLLNVMTGLNGRIVYDRDGLASGSDR